jgi:hypothetical protein
LHQRLVVLRSLPGKEIKDEKALQFAEEMEQILNFSSSLLFYRSKNANGSNKVKQWVSLKLGKVSLFLWHGVV